VVVLVEVLLHLIQLLAAEPEVLENLQEQLRDHIQFHLEELPQLLLYQFQFNLIQLQ
jgi:hypothetical protein|tara:strand:+ start:125 stop:295 length:171 start_codon:yes stop_codon:yes gene_type:complete